MLIDHGTLVMDPHFDWDAAGLEERIGQTHGDRKSAARDDTVPSSAAQLQEHVAGVPPQRPKKGICGPRARIHKEGLEVDAESSRVVRTWRLRFASLRAITVRTENTQGNVAALKTCVVENTQGEEKRENKPSASKQIPGD